MEKSSTSMLEDILVDGQQVPVPWMQSWAQHGAELMKMFSREMATLNERMGSMEDRIKTCVTDTELQDKAAETRDHFKFLGTEILQMESRISDALHHEAVLREALSNLLSDALNMKLENCANDIEKLQAVCTDEAESPVQAPLEKEGLENQDSPVPAVSCDALHVPDVVSTEWKSLVAEVSDLQARVKQEVLQRQFSVGRVMDFSVDLEFRKNLSRESLALLSRSLNASTTASKASDGSTSPDDGSSTPEAVPFHKPKALIMGHRVILSPKDSKASEGSTSPDDRSTSPGDRSTSSAPFYSTRKTSSERFGGSCKDFVERIKHM
jgi:hypothetical protein